MGKVLTTLYSGKLTGNPVFKNRFVFEICEQVHIHYKNLRLMMTVHDWTSLAEGMKDSLLRWKAKGGPSPHQGQHIELCRKKVISEMENNTIKISLNENLYKKYSGEIFAEGAGIEDETYIHFKIGDTRLELTCQQFNEVCDAIKTAKQKLEDSRSPASVQA